MKRVCSLFCLGFFLLFCLTPGFAQTGTTSLRGSVLDASGGAVPGASVKLADPELGVQRSTVSNETGQYEFLSLQPGT
jgi:protocatechuate 3,4-dioxygenase beta subunit